MTHAVASRRWRIASFAVRYGALALGALGALEALGGVLLETRLKAMYLGPGADRVDVLRRLVDVTVLPRAVGGYVLLGGATFGLLGLGADLVGRARNAAPRSSDRSSPRATAAAIVVTGLGVLALEYVAIRNGWPGALWPARAPRMLDVAGLAAAVGGVAAIGWLVSAVCRALVNRRLGRAARMVESAGWGGLIALTVWAGAFAFSSAGPSSVSPPAGASTHAPGRRPDVVMIVLDTARADRFSTFGARRETSPGLDALARRGTVFDHAMSTAPWTLPSHGTLFTGELPHRHGADWGWMSLRPEMRTLGEVFREAGYRTAAFTNNPWIGPVAGLDRGFDEVHPMWRSHGGTWDRLLLVRAARRATGSEPDEGAQDTVDEIERWLPTVGEQPLLLFVNLMELHDPNWPARGSDRFLVPGVTRARLRGLNQNPYRFFAHGVTMSADDFSLLADLYDGQVSYLDEQLARLTALLERRRHGEDLVLVVVGDHGENLGDHGCLSHVFSLGESIVHVPLVLVAPGRVPAGARVVEPVSLVDVAPTLEELAGVGAAGAQGRRGRSLIRFPPRERSDDVLIAEHPPPGPILDILRANDASLDLTPFDRSWLCARRGAWKLVADGEGAAVLYDLAHDPLETTDVSAAHPEIATELVGSLAESMAAIAAHRGATAGGGSAPVPDPATRDRLHSLGYM